ncbi:MAG: MFS transporter [bacterium]|nr:MFS transporter [bacterium]
MAPDNAETPSTFTPISYWTLLHRNRPYRRLWFGQVVSLLGDWFRLIALYHLVLQLTDASGLALGGVIIAQTLSLFVLSPVAGVVADRLSRKTIMIAADIVRAVLTLGFLFLTSPDRLWIAYGLTAVVMAVSSFFHPAFVATIPNLVKREELVTANALSSATWAAMLAIGSALGGLATSWLGVQAAFVIDAFSYLISAAFIATVTVPMRSQAGATVDPSAGQSAWRNFKQGVRYMCARSHVLRLLSVKVWSTGIGGSMMLLYTIFAEQVFFAGAVGMGVLYMARGVGATIGPLLARRIVGESPPAMFRMIGYAFLIMAGLYVVFATMPTLWLAAAALCLGTMASNVLWVFSSTLLQLSVPDTYRGRVFSTDFALFTILMSVSTFCVGWALDYLEISVRVLTAIIGGILFLPGIWWLLPATRGVLPAELSLDGSAGGGEVS